MRKDFKIAMNVTETAIDDPDVAFYENYACGSQRNYTAYCNPEVDKLIDKQSAETNIEKRKKIVWEIEKKLIEDDVRPVLFYTKAANCRRPQLKRLVDAGQQHLQRLALRGPLARPGERKPGRSKITASHAHAMAGSVPGHCRSRRCDCGYDGYRRQFRQIYRLMSVSHGRARNIRNQQLIYKFFNRFLN